MNTVRRWLLPGILAAALVFTGVWGYQEAKLRQNLQNRAESQYQKAFHELTWHVDNISGQLAQALISSSREQSILTIATVWRQVFAAQSNIGGLPLGFVSLSKTEKFLADTSDVAGTLLDKIAQGQGGFDEKSIKIIEELYNRAKTLGVELNKLGAEILNKELNWTEVEVAALASGGQLQDNTIADGFRLMEKKLEEYPEINLGENFAPVEPETRKISGKEEISLKEAEKIALNWWYPVSDKHEARLSYEGVGDIPTYGIEILPWKKEVGSVYIDISKLDGSVIWAMKAKTVGESRLNLSEGEKKAHTFLDRHGLKKFVVVQVQKEDRMGIYTFVPRQEEVLLYPDQVKIQVALDNGEVTGFEGTPFYMYHHQRVLPTARLSESNLRKIISPRLKVTLIRPALIVDTWGKEILTWEVRGTFYEEKFVIFYNADTGSEEAIIRITPLPEFTFKIR